MNAIGFRSKLIISYRGFFLQYFVYDEPFVDKFLFIRYRTIMSYNIIAIIVRDINLCIHTTDSFDAYFLSEMLIRPFRLESTRDGIWDVMLIL